MSFIIPIIKTTKMTTTMPIHKKEANKNRNTHSLMINYTLIASNNKLKIPHLMNNNCGSGNPLCTICPL